MDELKVIDEIENTNTDNDISEFLKYDSLEDINKCLHCDKPECTNCLRWINGV